MTKKSIFRTIGLYVFMILISVVQTACCDDEELMIVGNGSLLVYHNDVQGSNPKDSTSLVDREFRLTAAFLVENLAFVNSSGFIQGGYAASCDRIKLNKLDEESIVITLDKDFLYRDETISAGTNLVDLEMINPRFGFSYGGVVTEFLS